MANIIDECITLKDSDHKRMLFILSKIHFDNDRYGEFMNLISSVIGSTLQYKLLEATNQPAIDEYLTFMTPLYKNYDDPTFPVNHRVTVELYDIGGTTKISEKSMDTKDSPILR